MSQQSEIRRIADLPYYKEEHAAVMKEMDINDLDDLLDTLYDEERSVELIDRLKGVGPKIMEQWIELIEDHGVFDDEEETEPVEDEGSETIIEEIPGEEPEPEEEIGSEEEPEPEEGTGTIIEEEPEPVIEELESEVIEEGGYFAAPKPELDEETRRLLELRKSIKLPKFRRQEWFRYKKLGEKYRRPKGIHSKMRRRYKYRAPMASVGYKTPVKIRHFYFFCFQEVLIHNPGQLEGIDPKTQAVRVGHTVGFRKRLDIERRASELGIHILNRT
jgi:large subunit ribosomal protein L32e